ncbi:MAG TPA: D-glycero-beta-D-manno-heptose 1-phosphate adenylyltransferase [Deltaproteobacteria bacterium]|jgi:D-beta-D-heptose 7-phosphate kinase/D-beta-D-heptose 1-phosphate adenosyltransferase|nr:D-glycero-beta-D-manno-heptose 1-phosphate adenylyltransferase [Deltaproteobacteria bacterium]HOI07656.1 D-glycero-beta-D-manno-heptose 1-phosphate adenylyltransferase [Deltaproteobacteria bacterium]
MRYDFAFVGLGKVGSALLALLTEAGHHPSWVVSSKPAPEGIPRHPDIPGGPAGAGVVILAVPDSAIAETASCIASLWKDACRGIVFFHLSGLHTSDLLAELAGLGAEVGSLHPLQSILDRDLAQEAIREAYFTFEGTQRAHEVAAGLTASLRSTLLPLKKEDKVLYHAAAVIASNYLVAIASEASALMESVGLGMKHLIPLIRSTVANIEARGPKALTGPVQRGDWGTVGAHVEALEKGFPDILPSYLALGRYTARLASRTWPAALAAREKLLERDALKARVDAMKARGMKVVFTNGCFDILHEGHVAYLREARALGDALVVGLNSDASVARLKGPERPVNGERSRAAVMAALECVDCLCIFGEDTPYELIAHLKPDVLVKGGDWEPERIVGADVVKSCGGEVLSLPFRPGHSTTGLIEKIRKP